MSASVRGGSGPDVANLLLMRKAMEAHKSNAAQRVEGAKQEPSPPPPPPVEAPVAAPAPTGRTWYL